MVEMTEEQRVTLSEMFLLKTKPRRKVGSPPFNRSGSKYLRKIPCIFDERVDVYAVLDAFDVRCPARQHAIKKLLCSGLRGKNNVIDDLREARDAVDRAVQMEHARQLNDDEG
jgi:hypothetical protein